MHFQNLYVAIGDVEKPLKKKPAAETPPAKQITPVEASKGAEVNSPLVSQYEIREAMRMLTETRSLKQILAEANDQQPSTWRHF